MAVFNTNTPDHLKELQKDDPSLQKIREKTKTQGDPYFWKDDILMRQTYRTNGKELVIIPKAARMKVLQLAHNSPLVGHFGRARMLGAIRTRMDWPGIATDVRKMCSSCPICQKAIPALLTKAPLHPLPIIKNPFQRVAMDIFGLLKRTKSGHKYVLVIVDYATKWPEAFPLKNMTSETVVNCLIDLTARMGVPEEILTYNGANFISKTMRQFCHITSIHQIKTSPCHPQTDGMVERFNSTLKRLLRKLTQTHN